MTKKIDPSGEEKKPTRSAKSASKSSTKSTTKTAAKRTSKAPELVADDVVRLIKKRAPRSRKPSSESEAFSDTTATTSTTKKTTSIKTEGEGAAAKPSETTKAKKALKSATTVKSTKSKTAKSAATPVEELPAGLFSPEDVKWVKRRKSAEVGQKNGAENMPMPTKGPTISVLKQRSGHIFDPLPRKRGDLTAAEEEQFRHLLRTIDDRTDVRIRQSLTFMAINFFSVNKIPNKEVLTVKGDDFTLEFAPSVFGAPTLYDADILTFATSILAEKFKKHLEAGKSPEDFPYMSDVVFRLSDFNARLGKRSARSMEQVKAALKRLMMSHMTITQTNKMGEKKLTLGQSIGNFITDYKFVELEEHGKEPIAAIQVRLADWIVRDVAGRYTLWFPNSYFKLKALEKGIFMVARGRIGLREFMDEESNARENSPLIASPEELMREPGMSKRIETTKGRSIDYFFEAITLSDLAHVLRWKSPLNKLRTKIKEIILKGDFPIYELALDERPVRPGQQKLYIFRRDSRLKQNMLAAQLFYRDFAETLKNLTTRDALLKQKITIEEENLASTKPQQPSMFDAVEEGTYPTPDVFEENPPTVTEETAAEDDGANLGKNVKTLNPTLRDAFIRAFKVEQQHFKEEARGAHENAAEVLEPNPVVAMNVPREAEEQAVSDTTYAALSEALEKLPSGEEIVDPKPTSHPIVTIERSTPPIAVPEKKPRKRTSRIKLIEDDVPAPTMRRKRRARIQLIADAPKPQTETPSVASNTIETETFTATAADQKEPSRTPRPSRRGVRQSAKKETTS